MSDPSDVGDTKDPQAPLLEEAASSLRWVNGRCAIHESAGVRVVMVNGVVAHHYAVEDRLAEDLVLAQLQVSGHASSHELAEALGRSPSTLQRRRRRYEAEGAQGLMPKKLGPPQGQRLGEARLAAIRGWHEQGVSGREIARRLKVAPGTVQKALRRMGLSPRRGGGTQQVLMSARRQADDGDEPDPVVDSEVAASSSTDQGTVASSGGAGLEEDAAGQAEPAVGPLANDPDDRSLDRWFAAQGLLFDAVPLFSPSATVARAGVLLAIPLLVRTGLFDVAKRTYGHIGPAFYGLRTALLVFVVMALLRIKHPENIKEYSPPELGRLIGLDRAPEVKTLRRKLLVLAEGPCELFLHRLVERRVETHSEALGYLYVDGHVRVYHGKARLQKTHVARMRLSLPAVQDVWVNDAEGDPLFVVTQQAHPSLVTALAEVLKQARPLLGKRRVTVVFDRGGWSPQLFGALIESGFDVITYRKGKVVPVDEASFHSHPVPGTGHGETWQLADMCVPISKTLWMRQVTRLKDDHQTHIVTSRHDLDASSVAERMFNRWRQENFFKYMRQEFALDALVEHGHLPDHSGRTVPNPRWNQVDAELKKAKVPVTRLAARYGEAALDNPEAQRPTMRGFKIAHGSDIGIPLRAARDRVAELERIRAALPKRVPVEQLDEPYAQLPRGKKRLSDALKMLAWQVETDLARLVAPSYPRAQDEGRTLIAAALQSTGEITVDGDTLHVRLAPQSSPHRTRAIQQLCAILNETETTFPGTDLRLNYSVCVSGG